MSSIWSLLNPLRTGFVKLAPSGKEIYGTVIKHGKVPKTISVRADYQYWNNKYMKYFHSSSTYLVHDEENYCVSGDKVVIKVCRPITNRKHYFVRNIVKAFPRTDFYKVARKPRDRRLDEEYKKLLKYFIRTELKNKFIKNRKQVADIKRNMKSKALTKAIQNLKKLEKIKAAKEAREAAREAKLQAASAAAETKVIA